MKSFLACFCVLLAGFASTQVLQTPADRSTPQKTIQSYIDLFQKGLLEDAMMCVLDLKVTDTMRKRAAQLSGIKFTLTAVVSDVKIKGVTATAKVATTVALVDKEQKKDYSETVKFALNKGNWLIVPPKEMPEEKSFINSSLFVFTYEDETSKDPATVCALHLQQLASGFLRYAEEHQGLFSIQVDAWKKSIVPYLKSETSLACPLDAKGMVSYSINPAIVGQKLIAFKSPSTTVLLYEGKGMKPALRHNQRVAVAFVDGHVEMVDIEKAKKLRWKP